MKNSIQNRLGLAELKANWQKDMLSGFLIFLLALPLSLGIAKASDFPPIYGLITAMIGGVVVSFIMGAPLTIKGPAAGLIVIVAGSVAELGHGNNELGWHLALGAIVVAGALQVLMGLFKLGKYTDLFPLSAVHGMLAAIGIIIMSKQVHILAGFSPTTATGKPMTEPLELLAEFKNTIPNFFEHWQIAVIGLVSLAIVFIWPYFKHPILKKIPSALIVILVAIGMVKVFGIHNTETFKPLLSFDKALFDILRINESFEGFNQFGTFIKFVIMFTLVGSLESLLTVKAVDLLDPEKRKSKYDKDLIAVGLGNMIAGFFGGLPMISEVARSSANVNNGAKSQWANFFHGLFILIFLMVDVSFSDMIPMSALAALLIGVGWKLAHPREFGSALKIGADQLMVFAITVIVTLATDLLLGIAAGILLKFVLHLVRGVRFLDLFKLQLHQENHVIHIKSPLVFTNFRGLQNVLQRSQFSDELFIDFKQCNFIDHTSMESLHLLQIDFKNAGGHLHLIGLTDFKSLHKSKHHAAARIKK
ncbi:MAG: SulP family inorganic anion transporter [Flavobacteriales bacterium]